MPPTIDTLLGNLLAATWLNMMLFGISMLQLYTYWKTFSKEVYIKAIVVVLYCIDIAGVAGQLSTVYLDAITHYGDKAYLQNPAVAPRGMYLGAVQLQGLIVQVYLIYRIWRLSGNVYVSLVLWAGSLTSFGGGLGLTILNATFTSLADRLRQVPTTNVWLFAAASVDVVIALALLYFLTQAKRKSHFAHTHHVLTRLIISSLESGSITAALAIVVAVTFDTVRKTNWPVAFVYLLGRAYSLTMMYNLNSRAELRQKHQGSSQNAESFSMTGRAPVFMPPTSVISNFDQAKYSIGIQSPVLHADAPRIEKVTEVHYDNIDTPKDGSGKQKSAWV